MSVGCVVVAAGSGSRFGKKKQFVQLKNRLVIDYSLDVLKKHCERIVVVTKKEDLEFVANRFDFVDTIEGGKERMHSVYNGLCRIECDIVLIHDAARPLINDELIDVLIETAGMYDASIPVIPVYETLKFAEDGFVKNTVNRDKFFISQTPQAFRYSKLKKAYDKIINGSKIYTDEAAAWEEFFGRIKSVKGLRKNIKITSKEDLEFAECLLG